MASLAVRNEYCQQVVDNKGLEFLLTALSDRRQEVELVTRVLNLIKALAGNDGVKAAVGVCGGIPLILAAAEQHKLRPQPSEAACQALAAVCLRQKENCKQVIDNEGAMIITSIMEKHPKQKKVQNAAASC